MVIGYNSYKKCICLHQNHHLFYFIICLFCIQNRSLSHQVAVVRQLFLFNLNMSNAKTRRAKKKKAKFDIEVVSNPLFVCYLLVFPFSLNGCIVKCCFVYGYFLLFFCKLRIYSMSSFALLFNLCGCVIRISNAYHVYKYLSPLEFEM